MVPLRDGLGIFLQAKELLKEGFMGKENTQHTVMPKKLAEALMEAGVHHFDTGALVGAGIGGAAAGGPGAAIGGMSGGDFSGQGLANGLASPFKTLANAFNTPNTYQAGLAPTQQSDYSGVIGQGANNALAGYGTSQGVLQQQQALANQLLAQSQGQGPNPAQAQLAQNTGQNAQGQAALMASQRGASANPALIARLAAQQGANVQQQGVGQAATLGAQQQLAAQQGLAQQQQAMQTANLGQQQLQGQLFTGAGALQNTQNANQVANYGQMQGTNAQIAQNNVNAQNKTVGSLLNSGMGAIGAMFADGGQVATAVVPNLMSGSGSGVEVNGPTGKIGGGSSSPSTGGDPGSGAGAGGVSASPMMMAAPEAVANGGAISGHPAHPGNDYRNDIVPALLSKGEIVIPNSITQSDDAPEKAAEFIRQLMNKKDGDSSYKDVAKSKKSLKERVEYLEKCMGGKI